MNTKLLVSMLAVALLSISFAFGQARDVSGTVLVEDGSPAVGASVLIKGTTRGAYTDENGKFSVSVPENVNELVISFLEYVTQEVDITGKSSVSVSLQKKEAEEVVITALGIAREKKALGYSVQEVSGDIIANSRETNVVTALSGKVAGVQAFAVSGAPGAGANIRIRGSASISGNNQPLFVVDGIPVSNNQERSESGLAGTVVSNRALTSILMILRGISVLKGPSASVLYGSRAANGVILITTKKGSRDGGGMSINYNGSLAFNEVNKLPGIQKTFAQGLNGASSGNIRSWGAPIIETVVDPQTGIPVPAGTAGASPATILTTTKSFFPDRNNLP
jgi:TonB-dependent SusC/RagA subfamily outer membrane receptor